MLDGLRKGSLSIQRKFENYFEERKCLCGNIFKCKPCQKKKYCSRECQLYFMKSNKGLDMAAIANRKRFDIKNEILKNKLQE